MAGQGWFPTCSWRRNQGLGCRTWICWIVLCPSLSLLPSNFWKPCAKWRPTFRTGPDAGPWVGPNFFRHEEYFPENIMRKVPETTGCQLCVICIRTFSSYFNIGTRNYGPKKLCFTLSNTTWILRQFQTQIYVFALLHALTCQMHPNVIQWCMHNAEWWSYLIIYCNVYSRSLRDENHPHQV
jgi:hypothetical protein